MPRGVPEPVGAEADPTRFADAYGSERI